MGRAHDHDHGAAPVRDDHDRHDHHHDDHDHDHSGHDDHDHDRERRRAPFERLLIALAITAGFMLVEAGFGFWARSLALLADAGHMLADAAALVLALIAQRIATQSRTRARTYGSRRAEVIAAFANGVALALTAIWIIVEAVQRWKQPDVVHPQAMIATAAFGVVANLAAARVLSSKGHGHNPNTRAALAHVFYDAIGQVGALLAGVLIVFWNLQRADPLISVVIAVLVLYGGYGLVRDTTRVLMEGSPIEIDIAHIEETIRGAPGVADFHDLHVWSISEGFDVLTVHVVMRRGFHGTDVVQDVARRLKERHNLEHCTIQPEPARREELVVLGKKPRPAV